MSTTTTAENFRAAWNCAFDSMPIYGDYSEEIADELRAIANDQMDSAVRDLEAIHAEDADDYRDQVCDIVQEFLTDAKSSGEDLIRNGFENDVAEGVIIRTDAMEYYLNNEDGCEQAFWECSDLSVHDSIRGAIETAVFCHISQQVSNELDDALEDLEDLEDEMMDFLEL